MQRCVKMKFEDLLNDWKTKNQQYIVNLEELPDSAISTNRVKKNFAVWYTNGDNKVHLLQFGIWVINPNTDNEVAYFDNVEPQLAPPTQVKTFADDVANEINTLVSNGTIDSGIISSIDSKTNTAEVTVFVDGSNGLEKKTYRFKKNADGSISYAEVVS